MVTADELAARRAIVTEAPALRALREHLRARAEPLLDAMPAIPAHKALLSVDGGVCPSDGTALVFDPASPREHRCPRCDRRWTGERHDRHWARYQHLWLAERAAHLAALGALDGNARCAARAAEILGAYAARYFRYPNRDNVLGPSRLFFSTYLESIWITNYMAAAVLLRAGGLLEDAAARAVHQVADEAATLIGDYDEGFSNRQTWNNAALAAVAVWFEDEELAQRAIEGPTGLLAQLVRGYGRDGMWHEGENYHLFAIRGLLTGFGWARLAGVDVAAESRLAQKLAQALLAPALSALPDLSFPARKDSRYGVSLAQPAYLETWEVGLTWLARGELHDSATELSAWLAALHRVPQPDPEPFEAYLHHSGANEPAPRPGRQSLSWWALLEMLPELPVAEPWTPRNVLLESQGLAVLRRDGRYASLECGPYTTGHGHPDRLHLTVHAGGVHWLPDPGAGSYVSRDLFWYRSTLAHNAPRLDGVSQPPAETACERYDEQGDWAWARGRYGPLARTIVAGPRYVVDVVELTGSADHVLELPWHLAGRGDVATAAGAGRWVAAELSDPFATRVERLVAAEGPVRVAHTEGGATMVLDIVAGRGAELLSAEGPGLPGRTERSRFYVLRARGRNARIVTVLSDGAVRGVRAAGDVIQVETADGTEEHRFTGGEWMVQGITLEGARTDDDSYAPLLELDRPTPAHAPAFRFAEPPSLDGTSAGFDRSEPLRLAIEDQYRRSEEPYPGPSELSALAYAGWDDAALYVAVEVTKPDLCFRAADAEPQRLDNEPEDIHSDGLQVYLRGPEHDAVPVGYLVVPEDGGGVRVGVVSDLDGDARAVRGTWRRTATGYAVALAVPWPAGVRPHVGARMRFDLLVNEMLPDRSRRAGQLVWSGGNGWVWLRGDRQNPARFGVLELVA